VQIIGGKGVYSAAFLSMSPLKRNQTLLRTFWIAGLVRRRPIGAAVGKAVASYRASDAAMPEAPACGNQEDVMNNAFLVAAAAGLVGLGGLGIRTQASQDLSALGVSEDAGVFSRWLTADSPQCVSLSEIGSVSRMAKLTPEQFQFVRALYVAIPPISREIPPGDSAVVASANGKSMIALVAGDQACARFLAPDFVLSMLVEIWNGENGAAGQPL
jgi:hypothetical protein